LQPSVFRCRRPCCGRDLRWSVALVPCISSYKLSSSVVSALRHAAAISSSSA
jgi:hypothetical protein